MEVPELALERDKATWGEAGGSDAACPLFSHHDLQSTADNYGSERRVRNVLPSQSVEQGSACGEHPLGNAPLQW